MAEAIGLAASILTLTSASFKVAQSLYNIADSIGMAGLEFRACAEEISGFSRLLERVHELLKLISGISPEDMSLLKDVFDIFHRVLKEFQWLQDTLAPLLVKYQDSPGKLRQLGLRICWTLSWKNLLHFYRDIVRAQHRNLDTALSIINLLSSKDRTPQFINVMQLSLHDSIRKATNPPVNLDRGINHDWPQSPYASNDRMLRNGTNGFPTPQTPQGNDTISNEPNSPPKMDDHVSSADNTIIPTSEHNTELSLVHRQEELPESEEGLTDQEGQDIDTQIPRDPNPDQIQAAYEVWEDTRVISRKILRYAQNVSRESSTSSVTTEATTTLTSAIASAPIVKSDQHASIAGDNNEGYPEFSMMRYKYRGGELEVPYIGDDSGRYMSNMVKNLAREDRSRAIAEMEIKRGKKAGKKRVSKWQSMKSFLGLPQKSAETAEEETPSDSE